jgi:hypothetical protein
VASGVAVSSGARLRKKGEREAPRGCLLETCVCREKKEGREGGKSRDAVPVASFVKAPRRWDALVPGICRQTGRSIALLPSPHDDM